jgi:hypothetical protein
LKVPPANYAEAKKRPDFHLWDAAVKKELDTLKSMGVYRLSGLPPHRKAIGNRWVFEFKLDGQNTIPKGRLVAKGFHQLPGVDYGSTFAPVAKAASVRMVAAVACLEDWELDCFDATRAFLWGELEEEIYMRLPDGFELPGDFQLPEGCSSVEGIVMRLLRSIYGLKQASRVWYKKFSGILERIGMRKSPSDHGLFTFKEVWRGSLTVCLLVIHVDDGMGGSNSKEFLAWVKARVLEEFGLKDLGPVRKFLGVQFERDRRTRQMWVHQEEYIDALLKDYGMLDCNPVLTPMDSASPFGTENDAQPHIPDLTNAYQTMMGKLLFLSIFSRPDITYAVNRLTQYNSKPEPKHLAAAKRVLRYLKGTRSFHIHYGRVEGVGDPKTNRLQKHGGLTDLTGFSDSDWAGEEGRVSVSGYVWFYAGCLLDWSSRKQKSVALSSTEAEYMALSAAVQNGIWLRASLDQAHVSLGKSTHIRVDNQGAISLATNSSQHSRSKHIDIRYHFIREHIESGTFCIDWVPGTLNTADIFTKPLDRILHRAHSEALGLTVR